MCSRKCKSNQLTKSGSSLSISFPLTLKKSQSSFIHYIDDSDSENEEYSVGIAGSTSSDSEETTSGVRRSHSLKRRESLHRHQGTRMGTSGLQARKSPSTKPCRTEHATKNGQDEGATAVERTKSGGDGLADELNKLSKKLEEIESRLVKNERRTDKELRKLNLKRGKEEKEKEGKGARRGSEKGPIKIPVASGFAGLKRSATDFFRLKSRHTPVAEDLGTKTVNRPPSVPAPQSASSQIDQTDGQIGKQSLGQRLHKSSTSVLRRAASGIPSLIRPHMRNEQKSDEYSSLDSVNNFSVNSSIGSKNKLSSVSVTSLSAEEEAFEQCYRQPCRRSPLRAFVDERIFRRRNVQPDRARDSLDSSASAASHLSSSYKKAGSRDSESPNPVSETADRLLNQADRTSSLSHASVADEVFETDGRSSKAQLPPTPETKKVRKYRAHSTPNPDLPFVSTADCTKQSPIPVTCSHPLLDEDSKGSDGNAGSTRPTITPDILAEIEMYRCMAFQRMEKEFQTRNKMI